MVLLQAVTPLSVALLFLAGLAAGILATLAMDVAMGRIDEGETPPRIASGVLTKRHPNGASDRLASAVHYIAGTLTGALFVWLLFVTQGLFGAGLLALVAAAIVCYPLMVGFFALVVLPRSQGLARQRLTAIRRAWAIEAAVYLLVLTPLVGIASVVF